MEIKGDLMTGLTVEISSEEVRVLYLQAGNFLSGEGHFVNRILEEATKQILPEILESLDKDRLSKEIEKEIVPEIAKLMARKITEKDEDSQF